MTTTTGPGLPLLARIGTRIALAGCVLAFLAAGAGLVPGIGNRLDWWHYRTAFAILTWAAWGGVAAGAISLLGALLARRPRPAALGVLGLAIGSLVFGVPWYLRDRGRQLPPIHDIATDTDHPPQFVAVVPLRKNAPNKLDYLREVAQQQQKAYPDIGPALLDVPPREAFDRALAAARAAGWEIVAAVPEDNRIEATATTLWFGFKDDVVIRVAPAGRGSRVDLRSVSRVGRSDFGANAKRVRQFVQTLAAHPSH